MGTRYLRFAIARAAERARPLSLADFPALAAASLWEGVDPPPVATRTAVDPCAFQVYDERFSAFASASYINAAVSSKLLTFFSRVCSCDRV